PFTQSSRIDDILIRGPIPDHEEPFTDPSHIDSDHDPLFVTFIQGDDLCTIQPSVSPAQTSTTRHPLKLVTYQDVQHLTPQLGAVKREELEEIVSAGNTRRQTGAVPSQPQLEQYAALVLQAGLEIQEIFLAGVTHPPPAQPTPIKTVRLNRTTQRK
ncbi:MAG: hypothetical protein ACK53Y_20770, partial [bacterium]